MKLGDTMKREIQCNIGYENDREILKQGPSNYKAKESGAAIKLIFKCVFNDALYC
jgi:hypothetical protein